MTRNLMIKNILIIIVIFVISLSITNGSDAYKVLETSLPSILGTIIGGLTAGISIIFSVLLSTFSSPLCKLTIDDFSPFLISLKKDLFILIGCLIFSLFIPYFRISGIPLLQYPEHALMPIRDSFYTASEITLLVISISVIIEVFDIMFTLFNYFVSNLKKH